MSRQLKVSAISFFFIFSLYILGFSNTFSFKTFLRISHQPESLWSLSSKKQKQKPVHMLIKLVEVMAMYTLLNMDKISIQSNTHILLSRDKNSIQKDYAVLGEGWCQWEHFPFTGRLPPGEASQCKVCLVYNSFFLFSLCLVKQKHICFQFGKRIKTTEIFLLFSTKTLWN